MKKILPIKYICTFLTALVTLITTNLSAQTTVTYTTSGTWTCPAGVTSVVVENWGGGGAGGGLSILAAGGAGGGGGGAYSQGVVTVVPGTTYNYIVGQGGIGGNSAGASGGATSFNGLIIANGGLGGASGPSGAAGIGGVGVDFAGGNGSAGLNGTRSGAGGGGAGDAGSGGNASTTTGGVGGTSSGGVGGAGRTSTGAGNPGVLLGGGGGGAYALVSTNLNGGNGANGQVKLTYCSSVLTNKATITAFGNYNYNTLTWSLGHIPTACENVLIEVNRVGGTITDTTVNITIPSLTVQNFTLRNITNVSIPTFIGTSSSGAIDVNILGNLVVEGVGLTNSYKFNRSVFGVNSNSKVTIYGNLVLGRDALFTTSTEGHSSVSGNPSTWVMYGDMIFNPRGYTTNRGTIFTFNKAGTSYLVNNTRNISTDTSQAVLFQTLNIGNTNVTNLIMSGTCFDSYISQFVAGTVNVGANSILDMPANYSFNMNALNGSTISNFNLFAGSKLRLGGDRSLPDNQGVSGYGVAGSNFPGRFDNYNFNSSSTVEYYGSNAITQTIYNVPTYGNLIANNGSGTGRAQKINTAAVTANTSININNGADVTMGANITSNGPFNVNTNGGLYCGTNTVLGTNTFTLQNLGFLGMGSPQGITNPASNMSGNVQMTTARNFSTSGNYIYNGSVAQATGNGLPGTVNDITIDNSTTVTIAANLNVNGVDSLNKGTFDIGTTKISHDGINSRIFSNGTGKMKANRGIVEMKGTSGTAQNLSGSWFVNKNISTLINANTKGINIAVAPADTLLIGHALLYGTVTNSLITTNNNLTLLSRDTGTARFGEIVLGSGNDITGNVNVERWLPTTRKWRHMAWNTASSQTAQDSWMEKSVNPNDNLSPGYGTIVTDEKSTWASGNFDSRSISGPSVKYYDASTDKYVGIPNTRSFQMNSYTSYYNFVRGNRTSTPANSTLSTTILRSTGTLKKGTMAITVPATKFAPIGNPYASAIDIRKLDTANLTSTIYVWDPKLTGAFGIGAYQTLRKVGNDYVIMPGGGSYGSLNSLLDTLESGAAFFVRARASNGTITFKESAKNVTARAASFTGGNEPKEEAVFALLNIVSNNQKTLVDGTMAAFEEGASNDVDFDDALKLDNLNENLSIKRNGQLLAIERRKNSNTDDTISINLSSVRLSSYEWDISMTNMKKAGRTAFFIDKFLQTSTPLDLEKNTYVKFDIINTERSYANDRFMIVFKQSKPVKFLQIDASANTNTNEEVNVSWKMENEINIDKYEVEQSLDGTTFETVTVQVPTANNGGNTLYNVLHQQKVTGEVFYRVKAITINGDVLYSPTKKVSLNKFIPTSNYGLSVFPNPIKNGIINVKFDGFKAGRYEVEIQSLNSQTIYNGIINVNQQNEVKTITIKNKVAGMYQLLIKNREGEINTMSILML